jgi:hypothetical protein
VPPAAAPCSQRWRWIASYEDHEHPCVASRDLLRDIVKHDGSWKLTTVIRRHRARIAAMPTTSAGPHQSLWPMEKLEPRNHRDRAALGCHHRPPRGLSEVYITLPFSIIAFICSAHVAAAGNCWLSAHSFLPAVKAESAAAPGIEASQGKVALSCMALCHIGRQRVLTGGRLCRRRRPPPGGGGNVCFPANPGPACAVVL